MGATQLAGKGGSCRMEVSSKRPDSHSSCAMSMSMSRSSHETIWPPSLASNTGAPAASKKAAPSCAGGGRAMSGSRAGAGGALPTSMMRAESGLPGAGASRRSTAAAESSLGKSSRSSMWSKRSPHVASRRLCSLIISSTNPPLVIDRLIDLIFIDSKDMLACMGGGTNLFVFLAETLHKSLILPFSSFRRVPLL
uniref:Uncharacterized protein n=1 Tax=Arundo donax TaxID=35708 RepID=A0A0A9DWX2_ARUDO